VSVGTVGRVQGDPAFVFVVVIVIIFIIIVTIVIIIIPVTNITDCIYSYTPTINYVSSTHIVAAVLYLQSVLHVTLLHTLYALYLQSVLHKTLLHTLIEFVSQGPTVFDGFVLGDALTV
jgi:hypothetical protein